MPGRRHERRTGDASASTRGCAVGSVELPSPVLLASGTAGHGAELAPYLDLAALGAVVVKSLAAFEWAGNPAPRLHPAGAGHDQRRRAAGPGVDALAAATTCRRCSTPVHASSPASGGASSTTTARPPSCCARRARGVVAVEVNLSCPNLEGRRGIFAHDPELSARGDRGDGGLRAAAVGQAQPQHRPGRRGRRRGARGRRRGGHACQHAARAW